MQKMISEKNSQFLSHYFHPIDPSYALKVLLIKDLNLSDEEKY